jgi:hypothetical protein
VLQWLLRINGMTTENRLGFSGSSQDIRFSDLLLLHFLPLVLLFLCALLLTVVGLLCIGLLFLSVFLLLHVYCTMCLLLSYIL